MARPRTALVIVRKKLRSVSGDVYVNRALTLAAFARQAQVERFLYMFILPASAQRIALQHFPAAVVEPDFTANRLPEFCFQLSGMGGLVDFGRGILSRISSVAALEMACA